MSFITYKPFIKNCKDKSMINFKKNYERKPLSLSLLISLIAAFVIIVNVKADDIITKTESKGIGPISNVELKALDSAMAAKGKDTFATKCSACHKIGERYVGPDLAGVTKRRQPEWIMNMMLNPVEMTQKDEVAQELFGTFLIQMTFQNVSQDEARWILEFFRQNDEKK